MRQMDQGQIHNELKQIYPQINYFKFHLKSLLEVTNQDASNKV